MNTADQIEKRSEAEIRIAHFLAQQIENAASYFGYPEVPENNDLAIMGISGIAKLHLNNAGDPWVHGNAKMHTKEFEQEVLETIADLYGIVDNHWGYITSGGTEGNLYGQYMGREYFSKRDLEPILFYSESSHYSIPKNAKLLNLKTQEVKSQENGEMDYQDFEHQLSKLKGSAFGPVINLNIGTTMRGAIDDLHKVNKVLGSVGFGKEDVIIHADAALMGLIYPFIDGFIDLFANGVSSLALSGHKFLGAIHPCGVMIADKEVHHRSFGDQWVSYVGSQDTTISGSRNGFLALNLWYLLKTKGVSGYREEALTCIENARYLYDRLKKMDYPDTCLFPNQTIVTFKVPKEEVVKKYQLATDGDIAHVVVMQHITKSRIDAFCEELKG